MAIALRTDTHFDQVKAWAEGYGLGGFACKEIEGQNEHVHWCFYTDKNIRVVRQALTRAVPLKGNGAYSMTVVKDLDKYQRYCCKGPAEGAGCDVVWKRTIDDRLEEWHAAYWAEHRKLKRGGNVAERVLEECKAQRVEWNDRSKIGGIYIRELVAANKPVNLFSVRSNVNLLQCKLCPTDAALHYLCEQL